MMPTITNRIISRLISFSLVFTFALATNVWPNPVMDELEHLLVDTGGFNDGGFKSAITPCTNYVSGSQLLGRETAAQWIRVAFHDFATANVHTRTGGLDASIGFETLRPENSGSAMNDSLAFFAPYVNEYVSMADLIALSVVTSVGSCSSPSIHIPLRGGRIDATEGGAFGVPEPETSIEDTLNQFELAGFDQSDSIALTACGHTMGSVHHGGFPQVVPVSAVTPNNTAGGIHLDSTPAVFDIDVVNEYLSGTGQRGGPLVTTDNVTVRSDLRLYVSDGNTTIRSLSKSTPYFISKCIDVFARMINTTPAPLTEVISPYAVKPVNVSLSLDPNGGLVFSGYIRVFETNANVSVSWSSRTGSHAPAFTAFATTSESNTGLSNFGPTYYHQFSTSINSTSGISAFTVSVKAGSSMKTYTNLGDGYPLSDGVFLLKDESQLGANGEVTIQAAVLTSNSPKNVTAVFAIPTPQDGTLSPKITKSPSFIMSPNSTRGLFTIYTLSTQLSLTNAAETSVDIIAVTGDGQVAKDSFIKLALLGS